MYTRRSSNVASCVVKSHVQTRYKILDINAYKEMLLADLIKSISSLPSDDKRLKNLLLRNYLQFNLIYLTVRGGIEIGEDLVVVCYDKNDLLKNEYNAQLATFTIHLSNIIRIFNRYVNFFTC